jgi:hypothetical protein
VTVVGEINVLLDVSAGTGESVEDGVDVSTWLHGDDSQLILLINPDEEGFGIIVEDTSAFGPITVKTASLQESVSLPVLNIIYIFEQRKKAENEYLVR